MNYQQPILVSIIIPVHNAERNLAETISSALSQTWKHLEVLIVDDGSIDGSVTVARSFSDSRIKIFLQQKAGSGAARNKGLREARGKYIQFLDADDLLSADKIEKQVKILQDNPGKIAVSNTIHFFDGKDPYQGSPSSYEESFLIDGPPDEFLINLYGGYTSYGSMIQTNAWLSPIDLIEKAGPWSEFYSPDDDGEFFCRVLLSSKGVVCVKNCYNYYRKYQGAKGLASAKTIDALNGKFRSLQIKKQWLLAINDSVAAKKALANSAISLAVDAYIVDDALSKTICNFIDELGGTDYVPVLGGRLVETIKKIIGWRATRRLQKFLRK